MNNPLLTKVAIVGGGPSGMFVVKRLLESESANISISIFERSSQLGSGMPYSPIGACEEHVTNVSDNEIPTIVTSVKDWLEEAPKPLLDQYEITTESFNAFKVMPRLFFGSYLASQFEKLVELARAKGVKMEVNLATEVTDIEYNPKTGSVTVHVADSEVQLFDAVVICTGHLWPKKREGKVPGYFDSPYPPSKLAGLQNHPVAVRGSSLTAIDAIRTLARQNGTFVKLEDGSLQYILSDNCQSFQIDMYSRGGLLPAVRFHLDDSHLHQDGLVDQQTLFDHIHENDGFLSLDYFFRKNFIEIFREKDPAFYDKVKDMTLEEFVAAMMEIREKLDPFTLLKAEYRQAEKSIRRQESIFWKEMLAVRSFALNYPAKYLSAEDTLRLRKSLSPLISVVIAFIPQSSCNELLALHEAGVLTLTAVGEESEITPITDGGAGYIITDEAGNKKAMIYETFVDCIGQPKLSYEEFPFKSLRENGTISKATLRFKDAGLGAAALEAGEDVLLTPDGTYYLNVAGIAINDNFQVQDIYKSYNPKIYVMAVPFIGGYNPDYSGLDFCEAASLKVLEGLQREVLS